MTEQAPAAKEQAPAANERWNAYFYEPGGQVLRNKLDVRNPVELRFAEQIVDGAGARPAAHAVHRTAEVDAARES